MNYFLQTPAMVWFIRLLFCGIGLFVGKYFFMSMAFGPFTSRLALGVFLLLNIIGATASFIRSKISLIVLISCTLTVPLALFMPLDILMIKGAWYERCLSWSVAFLEQFLIPLAIAYYMWKAPKVRSYYCGEDGCQ